MTPEQLVKAWFSAAEQLRATDLEPRGGKISTSEAQAQVFYACATVLSMSLGLTTRLR